MPKLLSELRRLRRLSSSPLFLSRSLHSLNPKPLFTPLNSNSSTEYSQSGFKLHDTSPAFSNFISFRSFSIHSPPEKEYFIHDTQSNSEFSDLGFNGVSEVAEGVISGDAWYSPLVRTVISVLDGYHDVTGLPWWIVIASSTMFLRMALLPLLIFQLKKLQRFSELMPKLPPPFPPPLSGQSYIKQYLLFRKEKQAIGCPSALWGLATISVQVPCFLLWMTSIREMSIHHHTGFDSGGILWFQNLTETPHGVYAAIFPILVAGLHFTNVQISFRMVKGGKVTGLLGILAKFYRGYLNILTLPICLTGFYLPQGSLVYWVTNSSFTLLQQLSLSHPVIRGKLGLPDMAKMKSEKIPKFRTPEISLPDTATDTEKKLSAQHLCPDELVPLSVQLLAKGNKDRALQLLRLAVKKDPEYIRALILLGQTLMQLGQLPESTKYLESAISKLLHAGHPTKVEDVDHLILASTWAGTTSYRQGKILEALEHLRRVATIQEPEDPTCKSHYFDGLIILSSALVCEGHKDEAEKHLRRAVAYDFDKYNPFLQQCLEESDNAGTASDKKN